jgi:mannose-6-phosphate isomerase-like protein (cupin superfamily)
MDVGASDHTLQRNTRAHALSTTACLEALLVGRWDHLTSFAWIGRILPMATVDQRAVEKEWHARGFSCDLWIDAPGRVWRDFIHETDELVMLVEGEEEFEMNGQIHRLEIGQELLIPAGTYHTARNVGRTTSKWLYGYKRR